MKSMNRQLKIITGQAMRDCPAVRGFQKLYHSIPIPTQHMVLKIPTTTPILKNMMSLFDHFFIFLFLFTKHQPENKNTDTNQCNPEKDFTDINTDSNTDGQKP